MSAEPARIVSLVPSLTEALFELGLGERLVGVTDWCVHPAEGVAALPKLGGTKNPDVGAILALRPDLVLANREENRRRDVERLEAAGVRVWVTYPRSVREGAELLAELAELGASAQARERVVEPVLASVAEAEAALRAGAPQPRVFCPIWRDPWLAVGADTYANDLIGLCGGQNVCAGEGQQVAPSREPGSDLHAGQGAVPLGASGQRTARLRRYPRVELSWLEAAEPEVILLPDEPYAFGPADAAELARLAVPAARAGRIHLIDGTLVSWYGPRICRAIRSLRELFQRDPAPRVVVPLGGVPRGD